MATVLLAGAVAWAQLHITSFNSSGELTWTHPIDRGLYCVESTDSPSGPWNFYTSVVDSDWAKTNRMTAGVHLTNGQGFFRVGWITPNPVGIWNYRGYDFYGMLVVTGAVNITSMFLLSSNPPVVYGVAGSKDFKYVGPPTNALWWLGPQIGTESMDGSVELHTARLRLYWPTNCGDCNVQLIGDIWGNSHTGRWYYWTFGETYAGSFTAERR